MTDFKSRPGVSVAAVTKSDTVDIPRLDGRWPRALWVGVSGDVVLVAPDGTSATFKNASGLVPVQTRRVGNSTTATDIVAIY